MIIVNPAGHPRNERREPARRPRSLDGLRVGLLDNGKQNADLMVREVGRVLSSTYDLAEVIYVSRAASGADDSSVRRAGHVYDALLERLVRDCDVVVNGVGD